MEPLGRVYLHEVSRDAFSQREAEPCQPLGVQVMQPSWGVLSVLLLWVLQGFTKVPLRIPHRSYKDVVWDSQAGCMQPPAALCWGKGGGPYDYEHPCS